MKRAQRVVRNFATKVRAAARRVLKFGVALGAVAAGALVLFTRQSFKSLDALAKMSSRLGIASDELRALGRAAELSGSSLGAIDKAIGLMAKNVGDAADGLGEARLAIAELGLDAQKLINMNPDEVFLEFADAISKVPTQLKRLQLSRLVFGRGGGELLNLLQQGKASIQAMVEESKRLSGSFTRLDLTKVEMANDAFADLGRSLRSIFDKVAVEVAPFVKLFSEKATNAVVSFREIFLKNIGLVGVGFGGLGDLIRDIIREVQRLASVLKPSNFGSAAKAGIAGFRQLVGSGRPGKAVETTALSLIGSGLGGGPSVPKGTFANTFKAWFDKVIVAANEAADEVIKAQAGNTAAQKLGRSLWNRLSGLSEAVVEKAALFGKLARGQALGAQGPAAAVRGRPTFGTAFQPSLFTPQSITSQKAQPVHDPLLQSALEGKLDGLGTLFVRALAGGPVAGP